MSNIFTCPNCDRSFHRGYHQALEDFLMRTELAALCRSIMPRYIIMSEKDEQIMSDIQAQRDNAFELLAELIVMRNNQTTSEGYLRHTEKVQRFLEYYKFIKKQENPKETEVKKALSCLFSEMDKELSNLSHPSHPSEPSRESEAGK